MREKILRMIRLTAGLREHPASRERMTPSLSDRRGMWVLVWPRAMTSNNLSSMVMASVHPISLPSLFQPFVSFQASHLPSRTILIPKKVDALMKNGVGVIAWLENVWLKGWSATIGGQIRGQLAAIS